MYYCHLIEVEIFLIFLNFLGLPLAFRLPLHNMSDASKIRKITAEKKAKIGVEGYYNVDRNTFLTKTARAVELGKKKGLVYDNEYGLVATDPAAITAFIQANELEPLAAGVLDEVAPVATAGGSASSTAPAPVSSSKSPKTAKAPTSSAFRERVEKARATLEAGKFLNLSTMRQVKSGKKDLIYNNSFSLAAKAEDKQLLAETIEALGGSAAGVQSTEIVEQGTSEARTPDPVSRKVGVRMVFEKRLFGTQTALNAAIATGGIPNNTPATPPKTEEKDEEPSLEQVSEQVVEETKINEEPVISASSVPATVLQPAIIRRPVVEIKPATAPIVKPAAGSFSFATKAPLKTSFILSKPVAGV